MTTPAGAPGRHRPVIAPDQAAPGLPVGRGHASVLAVAGLLALAPLIRHTGVGTSPAYLLAGLLAGLPHGAVDHLVPGWSSARARSPAARVAVPLGYAAVAALVLVVFQAAPTPALLAFLVLSVIHFGAADEAFHAERDGRPVRYSPAGVLARGGPPVVVPLLVWPETVDPLLAAVAPGAPAVLGPGLRLLALGCLVAAGTFTVVRDLRGGRPLAAAEPVLLLGLFAAVPPALAVGTYFAAWHAARHVSRLLRAHPANRSDLAAGRWAVPLGRFARAAALPTLVAAAVPMVLAGWPGRPFDALAVTVAALAALTVPHSAVVAWLDRRGRPAG
ncbi:Brp/Blh family beta-carotene 15,15'-dioxygenase [Micromonospora sp. WMMA1998]|uniref:Brp/Blh family beta-carotene 15,15'-dioxygenase n=1 Tax=Micromonospora sp. WMMA1998 TaxID=3015167 RepID=UPI00248AFF4C|nr:Brp/Blh family beta-carotene 15,15'-dioxygenase [Micromonospora sp. WMMA1998]WBC12412.1 Brp/Blh family beta-carotene 15,15'-dioxygenase [Micromonospora sp. WMMA1998]